MRITVVSRIFLPEPAAASFRLDALVRSLGVAGAKVTVLTTTPPPHLRGDGASTGRVRRWPVLRDKTGYVRGYLQYLSFDVPAFFRVLMSRRPDLVVVEPPPTTGAVVRLACALRRVPYVYYAADVWSDAAASTGAPGVIVGIVRRVEAWALRGATAVIAVTQGVADRVRDLAGHERIAFVPNGIDTAIFDLDPAALSPSPLAVYVGTTSEWQGADVFIRAFARVVESVPEAGLVFVGQGSAWEALRALARQLGLAEAVRFVPTVPPEDAAAWLQRSWVALVSMRPGVGYDFAYPTKVNAALATGTPVIYAGPGPAAEVISGSDLGWVVDHDEVAVADALRAAMSIPPRPDRARLIRHWATANVAMSASAARAAAVVSRLADRHPVAAPGEEGGAR
ncbi:glycosyltransferase family 4 protein [Rarobacter faecitabidus]|nr:glycosyltransferase family 4 protein [Rarobacter faecitabidus]